MEFSYKVEDLFLDESEDARKALAAFLGQPLGKELIVMLAGANLAARDAAAEAIAKAGLPLIPS